MVADQADRYVAERLLMSAREDIGRADSKASVLLSGALALPALLLGSRWRPAGLDRPGVALLASAGVFWLAGVGCLVMVVLPRLGTSRNGPGLTFFADFLHTQEPEALSARVGEAAGDPVHWLLVQTQDICLILAAKYLWIRWGIGTLTPAAVLAACGLAAG